MKNEVCKIRAQSEPRNNWECQKWGKKDSVISTKNSKLTIVEVDTVFCNFSPFHCVVLCGTITKTKLRCLSLMYKLPRCSVGIKITIQFTKCKFLVLLWTQ